MNILNEIEIGSFLFGIFIFSKNGIKNGIKKRKLKFLL